MRAGGLDLAVRAGGRQGAPGPRGRPGGFACARVDGDRYGRTVARCTAEGTDIAGELVEQGMGLAFRRYSLGYVEHEDRARSARRGLWAGKFEEPWDWRRH